MKSLVRIVVVAMCLIGVVSAQAPNLVGQWQGTVAVQGKELRLVFVIATFAAHGVRLLRERRTARAVATA